MKRLTDIVYKKLCRCRLVRYEFKTECICYKESLWKNMNYDKITFKDSPKYVIWYLLEMLIKKMS